MLLEHGRNCDLDNAIYGDENRQPNAGKSKTTASEKPAPKPTKRKNANPLLEQNKQKKKKATAAQGASSLQAAKEMVSIIDVSPSFSRSFPPNNLAKQPPPPPPPTNWGA